MKTMYDSITLGKIPVKNRFVRSATFEYGGDDCGRFRQNMYDTIEGLAKGDVGLIITGMVAVDENAGVVPNMIKTYDETFVPGMQRLTDLAHRYGSKVVVQIAHCGIKVKKTDLGLPPMAISQRPDTECREMTKEDFAALASSFAMAAVRCKEAGADGIQIHASHGYLLSQALSPIFNQRTDEYGGLIENRARLLFEIYHSIREAVGNDYPVWMKINSSDVAEGGLSFEDSTWVCKQLSDMGIDAIEVSGGVAVSMESAPTRQVKNEQGEGYFFQEALSISDSVKTDVISVGGYRTPELLAEKLNEGNVKAISLCRPLVCEPDLISRWKSGDKQKAKCISCNRCFTPGPIHCYAFEGK